MSDLSAQPALTVRKRIVLHVPGYEPLTPDAQRRRLARTIDRSAAAWALSARIGPGAADGPIHAFQAHLSGPNWATQAEIRILAWDDLIARDLARPVSRLVPEGLRALAGLLADGTPCR